MQRKTGLVVPLMIVTVLCCVNVLFAGFVWGDLASAVNNERFAKDEGVKDILLHPFVAYHLYLSDKDLFLFAALLAAYPVYTEAVTYISGILDIIAALFI